MLSGSHVEDQPTWIIPTLRPATPKPRRRLPQRLNGALAQAPQLRQLATSTGVYALASAAAPLTTLILAPFLTRALSHDAFGALAVFNTFIALCAGVTQLGLNSAFFRSYNYDYDSAADRRRIFATLVALLLVSSGVIGALLLVAAPWVAALLFGGEAYAGTVRAAALVILAQNLAVPGFAWLRAENRAPWYAALTSANLVGTLGMTYVFIGIARLGITGALLAIACGYGSVVLLTLPLIVFRSGVRVYRDIAQNLLSFGVPLIFNFAAYWVLQLSDRFLLSRFGSLAETAVYAIGYSLGSILQFAVVAPFVLAWPSAMFTIAKRPDAARIYQLTFRWLSIALLFGVFLFAALGVIGLKLLFPPSYQSAATIIPFIALSYVFFGVYNLFAVGVGVLRRTWITARLTIVAALVNVGLNLMLIPTFGALGAALATLFAYVILAVVMFIVNQRLYPIPFEIGRVSLGLVMGIPLYLLNQHIAVRFALSGKIAVTALALIIYGVLLAPLALDAHLLNRWSIAMMQRMPWRRPQPSLLHAQPPRPNRVCMYVQSVARNDPRVMREATALHAAGYDVSIVDIEDDASRPAAETLQGVCLRHVRMPRWYAHTPFPFALGKAAWMFARTTWRLASAPTDIYHAHDVSGLPQGYIASLLRRKPLVFDAHELPLGETPIAMMSASRRAIQPLLRFALHRIAPRCATVIATSPQMAQVIQQAYRVKAATAICNYPPFQTAQRTDRLRERLGVGPATRIALYQGNIQPDRELDRVVRAAPLLPKDCMVVFLGKAEPATLTQLEDLIAQLDVADRVKILPPVPYRELLEWTASADLGLNLLSPDFSPHMNVCLPNKLFEYMMAGLPILSSSMSAVADILTRYKIGRIAPTLDPETIAEGIQEMLSDPAALATMRRNALHIAPRFSWESEQVHLQRLYHHLLTHDPTLVEAQILSETLAGEGASK